METEIRNNNVLIIDAMNLIHRSYYAYPRLTTKDGVATGGFFGFVKYLKSLTDKFKPKHIIVCSDAHRRNFRNDIYADYKGTRKETDDDLRVQFPFMERYLSLCNAKFIKKDNYEADDLIGTLAIKAKEYGFVPYIVSGDKDLFQMIDEDIHQVYISTKGTEIYDIERLSERYEGLKPSQIIDLKALSGDVSDNIPGVKGIGDKTAIKLLNDYDDLDGVYANIGELKGKRKENLINDKDNAYMSKRLATICCDVEIDIEELFTIDKHFSLCTQNSYDYLQSLNISKIFTKKDILDIPKEGLDIPFEIIENDENCISFRSISKYEGYSTKEGLEIYLYSMIFEKEKRKELIEMLKNAKENLILENDKNIAEIKKIEENESDLIFSLINNI